MINLDSADPPVLLDACVTINLVASGITLVEYSNALGVGFVMTELAVGEVFYLSPDDQQDDRERLIEVVAVRDLAADDGITIVQLTATELELFVSLAREVDDGEASTLAVSAQRGLPMATDDRKARRVASALDPPVDVVGTTDIVRQWSEGRADGSPRLPDLIRRIERRASFVPRRDDRHFDWWIQQRNA